MASGAGAAGPSGEASAAPLTAVAAAEAATSRRRAERATLEDFELLKTVGKGSFGKVVQVCSHVGPCAVVQSRARAHARSAPRVGGAWG